LQPNLLLPLNYYSDFYGLATSHTRPDARWFSKINWCFKANH